MPPPAVSTLIQALVQTGGGVLVLILGDRPARLAAMGLLASISAMLLLQDREAWIDPAHRILAIDTAYLALLAALSIRSPRAWLIAATALQLLAATTDVVIIFDHLAAARAWLTVTFGFGWAVFACILWGGFSARGRRSPLA